MYEVNCVILAAGKSTRMNMGVNKQFLVMKDKPVIWYTLNRFLSHNYISKVILVVSDEDKDIFKKSILDTYFKDKNIVLVLGGKERQDSLLNALKFVESEYVLVHDGARPFVSYNCITEGIEMAYKYGASSAYVMPKDTIKIKEDENIKTLNRNNLLCIQTPQCFKTNILISAYEYIKKNNKSITDESSALDFIGERTHFYLGDYFNIKITTKEDLILSEGILNNILGEV